MGLQGEIEPGPCAGELNSRAFTRVLSSPAFQSGVHRHAEIRSACSARLGMPSAGRLVDKGNTSPLRAFPRQHPSCLQLPQSPRDVKGLSKVTQHINQGLDFLNLEVPNFRVSSMALLNQPGPRSLLG